MKKFVYAIVCIASFTLNAGTYHNPYEQHIAPLAQKFMESVTYDDYKDIVPFFLGLTEAQEDWYWVPAYNQLVGSLIQRFVHAFAKTKDTISLERTPQDYFNEFGDYAGLALYRFVYTYAQDRGYVNPDLPTPEFIEDRHSLR